MNNKEIIKMLEEICDNWGYKLEDLYLNQNENILQRLVKVIKLLKKYDK